MASILKVDTIQDQSGNNIINESADTITIGASGDTITIPTGASLTVPSGGLTGQNYPAFEALVGTETTIGDAVFTKVPCNTETFDSDGYYDSVTNYRFTPLVAGKYYVYAMTRIDGTVLNTISDVHSAIYKNGVVIRLRRDTLNSAVSRFGTGIYSTIELNGSTDYVESFVLANVTSGSPEIDVGTTLFGAYRIGD
jgi:hypothetical protein